MPWGMEEVTNEKCKLSMSIEDGYLLELGISHMDKLNAPMVMVQIISRDPLQVRVVLSFKMGSVSIKRWHQVEAVVEDIRAFCAECEKEGLFTIVD